MYIHSAVVALSLGVFLSNAGEAIAGNGHSAYMHQKIHEEKQARDLPPPLGNGNQYDYVVVGGGTAGPAVAARLAQGGFQVALVEAGEMYQTESLAEFPATDVLPVGSDPTPINPIDWGFIANNVPGANGRNIHYARGKCLGGSSALNFMIYQRPTVESMDLWAKQVGDDSYTLGATMPYYKKSPIFTPPSDQHQNNKQATLYNEAAFERTGGPLTVSYSNFPQNFSNWMQKGMTAIGIQQAEDFNSGSLMGAQYCASTIDPATEERESAQAAFLSSQIPGLKVIPQTMAQKILFDNTKSATGVQVRGPLGDVYTLSAKNEVILSAGVFQSPQLLMVSGVGPADTLQQHGIEVIKDLPGVGQNMQDHPFVAPSYRVTMDTFTKFANDIIYLAEQAVKGVIAKNAALNSPVADFLAWEKIPEQFRSTYSQSMEDNLKAYPADWPEAEYISGAGFMGNLSNLLLTQPKDGFQYGSMLGVLIAPQSRGNVSIVSSSTDDLPIINPNWIEHPDDQAIMVSMFKRIRQAFNSDAMKPVVIGEEYYPGTQVQTDDEILEFVKNNVMTLWHASCTNKMGTADDPMAVVDSEARLFGVQNLRVVDASAFPFLPPGHPQSTIYMLAEKISQKIIFG